MTDEERLVWRRFEQLEQRVLTQGEALELGDETRAQLSGGARLVNISPRDTEDALRGVSTATTLLREIGRRIRDGSLRLGEVDSQIDALRDKDRIKPMSAGWRPMSCPSADKRAVKVYIESRPNDTMAEIVAQTRVWMTSPLEPQQRQARQNDLIRWLSEQDWNLGL